MGYLSSLQKMSHLPILFSYFTSAYQQLFRNYPTQIQNNKQFYSLNNRFKQHFAFGGDHILKII